MNLYKLVLIHFNVVDWSECRLGNAQVAKYFFIQRSFMALQVYWWIYK